MLTKRPLENFRIKINIAKKKKVIISRSFPGENLRYLQ